MRRFLLYLSVFLGVLLLLALLPGTQRLFAAAEELPVQEPIRMAQEMPALLMNGNALEPRVLLALERQQAQHRMAVATACRQDAQRHGQGFARQHDANGNTIIRRTYRHSVYQTFILGDAMG